MCLPNESISEEPQFPTAWEPFGTDMEHRQIAPNQYESRFVSEEAAQRAMARLFATAHRGCDRCGRLIAGGYLCAKCMRVETSEAEIRERIGRIA